MNNAALTAAQRITAAFLFVASVAATACAKDLSELEPYPCGDDGTCPAQFTCVPTIGCTKDPLSKVPFPCERSGKCPSGLVCLDAMCQMPTTGTLCDDNTSKVDCSLAGPGNDCVSGSCATSCTANSTGCADGEICQGSVCRTDCTKSNVCPPGLSCQPTYANGGRKVCLAPGNEFPTCEGVTSATSCAVPTTFQCPGQETNCQNSQGTWTCPVHAPCGTVLGRCGACTSAYEGAYCDGSTCGQTCEGTWACRAASSMASKPKGCGSDLTGWTGTCSCVLNLSVDFTCTETNNCEALCAAAVAKRQ